MHKIVERYSHSVISSNLRNDERHSEPDVLAAVALTSSFAGLLFRVKYANDAASYKQLRIEWTDYVTEQADRKHWPTSIKPWRVAVVALDYFLHDRCGACNGLGYQKHEHAPMLTDVACSICEGSGTAPLRCEKGIESYAIDLLQNLEKIVVKGGSQAMQKYASEMENMFTAYSPKEKIK